MISQVIESGKENRRFSAPLLKKWHGIYRPSRTGSAAPELYCWYGEHRSQEDVSNNPAFDTTKWSHWLVNNDISPLSRSSKCDNWGQRNVAITNKRHRCELWVPYPKSPLPAGDRGPCLMQCYLDHKRASSHYDKRLCQGARVWHWHTIYIYTRTDGQTTLR